MKPIEIIVSVILAVLLMTCVVLMVVPNAQERKNAAFQNATITVCNGVTVQVFEQARLVDEGLTRLVIVTADGRRLEFVGHGFSYLIEIEAWRAAPNRR